MLTLDASDVLYAVAATAAAINYKFHGDNIHYDLDNFGGLPRGQMATGVPTLIWPAIADNSLVYIAMANITEYDIIGVQIFQNGTDAAHALTGTFTIPAHGSAIYDGLDLKIMDAYGVRVS